MTHQKAQAFFAGLDAGVFPEGMYAPDFKCWTLTGGWDDGQKFIGGVRFLQSLFPDGLRYTIVSLAVEGDLAIAEATSQGVLADGQDFTNVHVFVLQFSGGRISAVKEYMNPGPVHAHLIPRMQALMGKS